MVVLARPVIAGFSGNSVPTGAEPPCLLRARWLCLGGGELLIEFTLLSVSLVPSVAQEDCGVELLMPLGTTGGYWASETPANPTAAIEPFYGRWNERRTGRIATGIEFGGLFAGMVG